MNFKSSRRMRNIFRITIQRLRLSISKAKYHNHMLNAIIKGEMLYFCQLDELGRVKISDPGQRLDLSNLSDPLPIKNLKPNLGLRPPVSTVSSCADTECNLINLQPPPPIVVRVHRLLCHHCPPPALPLDLLHLGPGIQFNRNSLDKFGLND